jgi:hypothetical protein
MSFLYKKIQESVSLSINILTHIEVAKYKTHERPVKCQEGFKILET